MKKILLLAAALTFAAPLWSMENPDEKKESAISEVFLKDLMRVLIDIGNNRELYKKRNPGASEEEVRVFLNEKKTPLLEKLYTDHPNAFSTSSSHTYDTRNGLLITYSDNLAYDVWGDKQCPLSGSGSDYNFVMGATQIGADWLAEWYLKHNSGKNNQEKLRDLAVAFPGYVPTVVREAHEAAKNRLYLTIGGVIAGGALITTATIVAIVYRLLHRKKAQDGSLSQESLENVAQDKNNFQGRIAL